MKKYFAAFVAVLMTLSCFSFVSAKDITLETGKGVGVAIEDVTATTDDTRIEVPISIAFAEGVGIAGAKIIVKYDVSKLDLIIEEPDEDEETLGTPYWTFKKAEATGQVNTLVEGQIIANFASATNSSAVKNGFFMLEFAPVAGASGEAKIWFDTAEMYFVDENGDDVTFQTVDGNVSFPVAKYTVSFATDYGTAPDAMADVEEGSEITLTALENTETHRFGGWSDGENTYTDKYTVNGNVTLTAVWNEIVKYTVSFSEGADPITVEAGESVDLPVLENEDLTFLGWTAPNSGVVLTGEYIPTATVLLTAKWGGAKKVYISGNGDDANDGMTADKAVATFARVNALLGEYEDANTVVIVGTVKSHTTAAAGAWSPADTIGINSKSIVITGADENAVLDVSAGSDARVVFGGNITFKDLVLVGSAGDGRMLAQGYKIVFEDSVTNKTSTTQTGVVNGRSTLVAGTSGTTTAELVINGGEFTRVYSGDFGSNFTGKSKIIVNGGYINHLGIGKGYYSAVGNIGLYEVEVNGGRIDNIKLDNEGNKSASYYSGVRYYTVNAGDIGDIVTTSGSSYIKGSSNTEYTEVPYRKGVTVFEINAPDVVKGAIKLAKNKKTSQEDDDSATRVIIYNNGSFKEGQVTDKGALVFNVKNGALKAAYTPYNPGDIAGWADKVQFLGFTYTLPEEGTFNAVKVGEGNPQILADLEDDIISPNTVAGIVHDVEFTNAYKVTVDDETFVVEEGDTIALTRLPQNGNLKHIGWATTEDATVPTIDHTTDYAPTADVTLYPVWAEAVYFTATFVTAHGTAPKAISIIDDDENNEADVVMVFPGYDGKQDEHFTFVAWTDGTNDYNAGEEYTLTSNVTFTAKWDEDPKATVTYVDTEAAAPEAVTDYVGTEITIAAPGTVEGFDFLGWTDGETTYQEGDKLTITADGVTLTAKWGVKITVNANGAKGTAPVIGGEIGALITLPTDCGTLTKVNNTFAGWSLSADGEIITEYTVNPADTLYAIWNETVVNAGIIETKVVYNSASNDYTVDMYFYGQNANTVAFGYTYGESLEFVSFVPAEGLSKVPAALEVNNPGYYAFAVTDTIDGKIEGASASAGNGIHLGTLNFTYKLTKEDYSEDDAKDNIAITAPANVVEYVYSEDYFLYTPAVTGLDVVGLPVVFDEVIEYEIVDVVYEITGSVELIRADGVAPKNFTTVQVYVEDNLYKTFTIEDSETTTEDSVFEYTIELPAGEYVLKFDKVGYAAEEVELIVEAQEGAGEEGFEPTPISLDLVTLVPGDVVAEFDVIDLLDFAGITSYFGKGELPEEIVLALDIDEDGAVTVDDLAYVKYNYGYKG